VHVGVLSVQDTRPCAFDNGSIARAPVQVVKMGSEDVINVVVADAEPV
jgi:hypothetical protein